MTALIDRWVMKWLLWLTGGCIDWHWLTGEWWSDCPGEWFIMSRRAVVQRRRQDHRRSTRLQRGTRESQLRNWSAESLGQPPMLTLRWYRGAAHSHRCGIHWTTSVDIAVFHTPMQASHPDSGISVELANSVTWSVNRCRCYVDIAAWHTPSLPWHLVKSPTLKFLENSAAYGLLLSCFAWCANDLNDLWPPASASAFVAVYQPRYVQLLNIGCIVRLPSVESSSSSRNSLDL